MTDELTRRMGRPNKGAAHVDRIDADPMSKARAKAILATMSGELTVAEACEALGVSTTRFEMLRAQMLECAVAGLAPKKPGRPRKVPASNARVVELEAQVRGLERQVRKKDLLIAMNEALSEVVRDMQREAEAGESRQKGGRRAK